MGQLRPLTGKGSNYMILNKFLRLSEPQCTVLIAKLSLIHLFLRPSMLLGILKPPKGWLLL